MVLPFFKRLASLLPRRRRQKKERPLYAKILRGFMFTILGFLLFMVLIDINFLWLFGKSPKLSNIRNPKQSIASEVYSADGKMIGRFYKENRTPVEYSELSPLLVKTLIATEDERYYEHFGVDVKGIFSAFKDLFKGKRRGASTIPQQLIKNLFKSRTNYSTGLFGYIPGVRIAIMKFKEWIGAVKLELFYSKEEILVMYLNTVDFGNNTFGIKTAARVYFGKMPDKLDAREIAMLIGMLKAPSYYNPLRHPDRCRKRRNTILDVMQQHQLISKTEKDSVSKLSLGVHYKNEEVSDGDAAYFRMAVASSLSEWCSDNNLDLYSSGLKIYTTVDSRMQRYAEYAVKKHMNFLQNDFYHHWGNENPWRDMNYEEIPNFIEDNAMASPRYKAYRAQTGNKDSAMKMMEKPIPMTLYDLEKGAVDTVLSPLDSIRYCKRLLHIGFVAIEPQNRFVRAWVGDLDFRFFKFDHVSQAKRQPGSTFKLFVYAAAIASGLEPCDTRRDQFIEWKYMEKGEEKIWRPHNADGKFMGIPVSLKYAFARSINSIAVALAKEIGIEKVVEYAYRMGIKTNLKAVPSLCLGSSDVSLLELVNSYATVIAEGFNEDPVLITRIEDSEGNVLWEHKAVRHQTIDYETAYMMQELLKAGLVEREATTQALRKYDLFRYGAEFGGKTGTSSLHSDGWFVGVSPKLVAGIWVGGEQRSIHFRNGYKMGEGGYSALPVFGLFMEKVMADKSLIYYRAKFPKPSKPMKKNYQCYTVIPDSLLNDSTDTETDSIFVN